MLKAAIETFHVCRDIGISEPCIDLIISHLKVTNPRYWDLLDLDPALVPMLLHYVTESSCAEEWVLGAVRNWDYYPKVIPQALSVLYRRFPELVRPLETRSYFNPREPKNRYLITLGFQPQPWHLDYACRSLNCDLARSLILEHHLIPDSLDAVYNSKADDTKRLALLKLLLEEAQPSLAPSLTQQHLARACSSTGLGVIQYLVERWGLKPDLECLNRGCDSLAKFQYLLKAGDLKPTAETLTSAITGRHSVDPELIRELVEDHKLLPTTEHLLLACEHKDPWCVRYLLEVTKLEPGIEHVEKALRYQNTRIVEVLQPHFKASPAHMDQACKDCNLELVQFLTQCGGRADAKHLETLCRMDLTERRYQRSYYARPLIVYLVETYDLRPPRWYTWS